MTLVPVLAAALAVHAHGGASAPPRTATVSAVPRPAATAAIRTTRRPSAARAPASKRASAGDRPRPETLPSGAGTRKPAAAARKAQPSPPAPEIDVSALLASEAPLPAASAAPSPPAAANAPPPAPPEPSRWKPVWLRPGPRPIPPASFRVSYGVGQTDLGAAYRIGAEAELWRGAILAVGGRIAYGKDWRRTKRYRSLVVTEPAAFASLEGGLMSFVAGAGVGVAYVEEGEERFCVPAEGVSCPAPARATNRTTVSLSATAGSLFRARFWALSIYVRAETAGFSAWALTLNIGTGLIPDRL